MGTGNLVCTSEDGLGILPRVIGYVFDTLEQRSYKNEIRVSFLEVHNEEIRDLMKRSQQSQHAVMIEGTIHDSFSDRGLVADPSFLLRSLLWWQGERRSAPAIFNDVTRETLAFFQQSSFRK